VSEHRGAPSGDGGGDVRPRPAAAEAPAEGHVDERRREARKRRQDLAPALPRARAVRAHPHLHLPRCPGRRSEPAMRRRPLESNDGAYLVCCGYSRHGHRHRAVWPLWPPISGG
jgi:hypothetical protein